MAAVGHEDAFLRPGLNACYRFCQGTFAGTRGNGRDAPQASLRGAATFSASALSPCDKTLTVKNATEEDSRRN
jgi:hypothetical protein